MVLTEKLQHVLTYSFLRLTGAMKGTPNETVNKAFKEKYPKASFVRWHQIDVSKWRVQFFLKESDFSSLFDSEGNWLETFTSLSFEYIPKPVQENFKEKHSSQGIQKICHIKTSTNDIFEIQWSNGVFEWKLLYDISGKIVGKLIV